MAIYETNIVGKKKNGNQVVSPLGFVIVKYEIFLYVTILLMLHLAIFSQKMAKNGPKWLDRKKSFS